MAGDEQVGVEAGVAGSPVDRSDDAQTASRVVEAYLRLEVGQGAAADRERVRAGATAAVAARLLERARRRSAGSRPAPGAARRVRLSRGGTP